MKLVGLIFFLIYSFVFTAPKYKIESLDVLASIERDGALTVQEMVLYDAKEINGILYNIDAKGETIP